MAKYRKDRIKKPYCLSISYLAVSFASSMDVDKENHVRPKNFHIGRSDFYMVDTTYFFSIRKIRNSAFTKTSTHLNISAV